MECRDTQISCMAAMSLAEPPEAADLKKVSNKEAPKHQEGRAIRHAPHREAFIPDVKSWVPKTG
jgi:hypothetical protein